MRQAHSNEADAMTLSKPLLHMQCACCLGFCERLCCARIGSHACGMVDQVHNALVKCLAESTPLQIRQGKFSEGPPTGLLPAVPWHGLTELTSPNNMASAQPDCASLP